MSSDDAVRTADVSRDPAAPVRIFVRPVGSALPLGIMSFSVGMLLLAALDDGWVAATQGKQVGLLLVAFVFPLELLASVFAFLARDTLGGTVLAFFAGSWVAHGLVQLLSAPVTLRARPSGSTCSSSPRRRSSSPVPGRLASRSSPCCSRCRLRGRCSPGFTSSATARGPARGRTRGRGHLRGRSLCRDRVPARGSARLVVLPVLRRGAARDSFEGDLSEQLRRAGGEAGVREQL